MNIQLYITLLIAVISLLILILQLIRKNVLNLKYSLLWLFSCLIMLIVTLFPGIIEYVNRITGIQSVMNCIFVVSIFCILSILLSLTVIISRMREQNKKLAQSVALAEKLLRDMRESKTI